jgi:predicted dienelactone hydrolase
MVRRGTRRHRGLAAVTVAGLLLPAGLGPPARAIEEVELELPLLEVRFRVKVSELGDPAQLRRGSSDLAELDRATGGLLGRRIAEVFTTPLPLQTTAVVEQTAGSALLDQALLAASTIGSIDGLPLHSGTIQLSEAFRTAAARGEVTLHSLLQAVPGRVVQVDLPSAVAALRRIVRQRQRAEAIVARRVPRSVDTALARPGAHGVRRSDHRLAVPHRERPLEVVEIAPRDGGNGRLVVISHGLWDGPDSFLGWAVHLASHGTTVLLPRHPGSDQENQRAILNGEAPPPPPEELKLRPLDVKAVIDAAAAGRLRVPARLDTDRVVVLGHSWGATTALQLAGVQPSSRRLRQRCTDLEDPERNLSWVLQCSFLDAADRAGLADPRVIAAAAVSPPLNLLFDHGAGRDASGRVLLVTGTRDWVVPPDPEGVDHFEEPARKGHQLVVVGGGDHFNLRGPVDGDGGPLRALLLAWVNGAHAAGERVTPGQGAPSLLPPDGWGDAVLPIVAAGPPAAP